VPDRDQERVQVGQPFTVRSLSLPGLNFTGRVDVVSDSLDPATRTVKVRGSLTNSESRLKAEMFAKAEFALELERGTEVSSRAVFLRGDKHCVLREDAPCRYSRRSIFCSSAKASCVHRRKAERACRPTTRKYPTAKKTSAAEPLS